MITCWDAALITLGETTKQFAPEWRENAGKKSILGEYCEAVGSIANRAGSTFFDTEVDPETKCITMSFDVADLEVRGAAVRKDGKRDLPLADLIDRSIVFRICTNQRTGRPLLVFTFPGIWDKA